MKLEQWVLFIDMLGYREINGSINNDENANDFISFMKSNENIFASQITDENKKMYSEAPFDLYKFYDIQLTFVSDSLIINYKPKEFSDSKIDENIRLLHSANTLFIIMNRLQTFIYNCLKEKQILIRGGISNKYCYVDQNFAVGEGLIDAYHNESKVAIYPRIVLSEHILKSDKLIKLFNFLSTRIYNFTTFLKTDQNNVTYLDYLNYNIAIMLKGIEKRDAIFSIKSFLGVHKDVIGKKILSIENALSEATESDKIENLNKIKAKIVWLKEYHNESVKVLMPQYLIE